MALSSVLTKVQYNGDGADTSFPVTFIFYADSDLRVIEKVTATGVETVKALTTDYTLTGGNGATGNLTMLVAPASGTTLTIKSNIADIQETELPAGGKFPSAAVERRLDIITRLIQQQAEEIARSVSLAESSETGSISLPEPSANTVLGWNAAADGLENLTPNTDTYVTFPASSVDNALPRFSGTGGKTIQGSNIAVDDNDIITFPNNIVLTKGGDIASASPLVVDNDGAFFDVSGTTNFSAMTVPVGTLFMLQFDGVLTMTHGASLLLPGGVDITTAAGDRMLCYATAADTVITLIYSRAANTIINQNLQDYGEITNAIGSIGGGTQDIDLTLGNSVSGTVDTSTTTFTFSNPTASDEGCGFTLVLTNGGSQTVNWPSSVDWAGGTAPTLTSSGVDVLVFWTIDGGTTWHGAASILDSQ